MSTKFILGALLGVAFFAGSLLLPGTSPQLPTASAEESKKKAPAGGTGIEWHVEPEGVEIYLNGKKIGEAGRISFTPTKPGKHAVRLVRVKDETEIDVEVKKGQTLKFTFKFEDD